MRIILVRLSALLVIMVSGLASSPSREQGGIPGGGVPELKETQSGSEDLDRWIGQMLMVGFRGTELTEEDPFLQLIGNLHLGGVVLFDYDVPSRSTVRNIVSAAQTHRLTDQLQRAARSPLFIAIDQEGGRVVRLKERHGFPATLSAAELGRRDEESLTRSSAGEMADLLTDLGINLNFAPVLDLAVNPDNPVIAALERSFGSDSDRVLRHGRWTIEEFHRRGLLSAVKHFPGHGSSREDSHLGLPEVTGEWGAVELEPFRRLIQEGLPDMIMTAHLFNADWDPEYPATLSGAVITTMLRQDLGFQGVIVSDDMQMGAIVQNYTLEKGIERAVEAGVDILLFANNSSYDPKIAEKAFNILRRLVDQGVVSRGRIEESFQRISRLKEKLRNNSLNN
ncbi:MAG: glycoside hydrolase family 3 N-terminal domain-containing protein [Acidobacteriota bacterium]